jgi:ribosome-binding factor A
VTRAEVSGDLQHAKVHVSIMGTPKEQELTLRGLRHAAGFIQSKLAQRLKTRFTPVLNFVLDQGVKNSIEMTRLINEALGKPTPAENGSANGEESAGEDEAEAEGHADRTGALSEVRPESGRPDTLSGEEPSQPANSTDGTADEEHPDR